MGDWKRTGLVVLVDKVQSTEIHHICKLTDRNRLAIKVLVNGFKRLVRLDLWHFGCVACDTRTCKIMLKLVGHGTRSWRRIRTHRAHGIVTDNASPKKTVTFGRSIVVIGFGVGKLWTWEALNLAVH